MSLLACLTQASDACTTNTSQRMQRQLQVCPSHRPRNEIMNVLHRWQRPYLQSVIWNSYNSNVGLNGAKWEVCCLSFGVLAYSIEQCGLQERQDTS